MKELLEIIERFQKLKEITGTSKSSSYAVTIRFDPWEEDVRVELGGYDVGYWARHEYLDTTRKDLLKDLSKKVDEAEKAVAEYENEDVDLGVNHHK